MYREGWCCSSVGIVLSIHETLGLILGLIKPGTVVHTCNPCTQEVEARRSEIQGNLQVCNMFKASLNYMSKKKTVPNCIPGHLGPHFLLVHDHNSYQTINPGNRIPHMAVGELLNLSLLLLAHLSQKNNKLVFFLNCYTYKNKKAFLTENQTAVYYNITKNIRENKSLDKLIKKIEMWYLMLII